MDNFNAKNLSILKLAFWISIMNAKRPIYLLLFLGISSPNYVICASELSDRVNTLTRDYVSCLGNDYQSREAACSGIYEELSKQQALLELQKKYGNAEKQQRVEQSKRLETQKRDLLLMEQRKKAQQEHLRQDSEQQQRNHFSAKSNRPAADEKKKVSEKDLVLYELLKQRQLCERSQPRDVCLEISQARYKELEKEWAKEKPQRRSNEPKQPSQEYATRENAIPPNSSAIFTERNYGQTKPEVTPNTTYEWEYSKLQRPQEHGVRKPQELAKPEGIRQQQELRKPQELGQRQSIGSSLYELEYSKMQNSQ
jgi:hypothetical protein